MDQSDNTFMNFLIKSSKNLFNY